MDSKNKNNNVTNGLIPKVPDISMNEFRDYLRETADYTHRKNQIFNGLIKEKTIKRKSHNRYPFF